MKRWPLILLVPVLVCCVAAMVYVPHRRAAFRAVSDFQPTDVANLISWHDASTLIDAEGTAIATWTDSGPNGYDLYQGTAANRPYVTNNASRIGNQRFLYFDGTNDRMTHGAATVYSQPNTYFIVAYCADWSAQRVFLTGSNNVTRNICYGINSWRTRMYAGSAVLDSPANSVTNIFYLFEYTFDNAAPLSSTITNGVTLVSSASSVGTLPLSGLTVGTQVGAGGSFLMGGIAEIIIYNSNVSAGDRTSLRTYFTDKYGPYASW